MDLRSRKGILKISNDAMKEYVAMYDETNPVFRDFIPASVEYDFMSDTMKLHGYSKHFRPLFDGEEIPEYEITLTTTRETVHHVVIKFRQRNVS